MHSHLAKMIGQYLVETRTKKGLSQKELADSIDVSAQFLGRIERGDVMIPEQILINAISFLKLSEKKLTKIYRISSEITASEIFKSSRKRKGRKSS